MADISPGQRLSSAMAFDTARKRAVLFGGSGQAGINENLGSWMRLAWTQITPALRPSPRTGMAMAYDAARGRTILFGGADGTMGDAETLELGRHRVERAHAGDLAVPTHRLHDGVRSGTRADRAVRRHHRAVRGERRHVGVGRHDVDRDPHAGGTESPLALGAGLDPGIVLIGGEDTPNYATFDDRWEWDGVTWTNPDPIRALHVVGRSRSSMPSAAASSRSVARPPMSRASAMRPGS